MLRNPSFEQGSLHWYIEGEGEAVSTDPHGGAQALRVALGGVFTAEPLLLEPGDIYALSVWGKLDGEIDLGHVGVTYRDAGGRRLYSLEPPEMEFIQPMYVQKQLTFTVPPGVKTVTVSVWKNPGPSALLVDDFNLALQRSPEPVPDVTPAIGCQHQQLMVPAYFYPPTGLWEQMIEDGSPVSIIVLNPDSGVDTKHEWRYDTCHSPRPARPEFASSAISRRITAPDHRGL